ncbi:MAG: chloride channel protein [Spirochaetales bacterium]|nr:chloride channel protein [Spirochaetales bacterium]
MRQVSKENKKSLIFLFQWLVIAITAGISGSLVVAFLFRMLELGRAFVLGSSVPFPLWTTGGALICGLTFYRLSPTASGDGIPSYIKGVLENRGEYSFRETAAKSGATLLALMTLTGGGMLGPSGRISAGINSRFAQILTRAGVLGEQRRIAAICGMAAAVGAIFHAPVGGGIFAVEVLQRTNMRYHDLFPSILSSSVAVYIYNFLPYQSPLDFPIPEGFFQNALMPFILATALGAAFLGKFYTFLFEKLSKGFNKNNGRRVLLKLFIGSSSASVFMYILSPHIAGNFRGAAESIIAGRIEDLIPAGWSLPPGVFIILLILLVSLSSSLAIASGISVGLTSPSVFIGILAGVLFASLFGFSSTDSEYFYFLVSGVSGVLSSTINVPVSAAVIAVESFGASYGFCAGISSVVGFQVNRHHTLYDSLTEDTD